MAQILLFPMFWGVNAPKSTGRSLFLYFLSLLFIPQISSFLCVEQVFSETSLELWHVDRAHLGTNEGTKFEDAHFWKPWKLFQSWASPPWDLLVALPVKLSRRISLRAWRACQGEGSSLHSSLRWCHALWPYQQVPVSIAGHPLLCFWTWMLMVAKTTSFPACGIYIRNLGENGF